MRLIRRLAAGATVLTALFSLLMSSAAAGNFAEVTLLDGAEGPPVAGEARDLEFRLLQHGVTPVDFGDVDVIATLAGADESVTVAATNRGDGRWAATMTFPVAGDWQVRVTHNVFATSEPMTLTVASAVTATTAATSGSSFAFPLLAAAALLLIAGLTAVRLTRKGEPATIPGAG